MPDKKGSTARQRNTIHERAGKIGPEWRPDPPPQQLAHLFQWFAELRNWGPLDLKFIAWWSEYTGRDIGPFEIDVFHLLEAAFVRAKSSNGMADAQDIKAAFRSMAKPDKSLKKPEVVARG